MTAINGSAAAVTGAASGIGRALALELAARGCDLALADRDEAGLQRSPPRSPRSRTSARSARTASMSASPSRSRNSRKPRSPRIRRSTSSSTMPASPCSASSTRSNRRRWTGCSTSISGAWCTARARSCRSWRSSGRRISSISPRSSASSRRPARPPIARRNSRCAAFRKACGMSWRWRTARCGCRWCIPAASPPTSSATPAPAPASPTTPAARNRSTASMRWRRPRRPPPRCASSSASRRTSRGF